MADEEADDISAGTLLGITTDKGTITAYGASVGTYTLVLTTGNSADLELEASPGTRIFVGGPGSGNNGLLPCSYDKLQFNGSFDGSYGWTSFANFG